MFAEINPAYLVAALFLVTSGTLLYMCFYLIVGNVKSKMRRDYFFVGMHLVLFSFFYALMTIAANETLIKIFWACGFISGCFFYPRWIIFLSNTVTFRHAITKHLVRAALVFTAVLSVLCVFSGDVVFVPTKYGNQFSYQGSLLFIAAFVTITLFLAAILVLHFRWWLESEMERHRRQALSFIVIAAIFSPIGYVTDFILPIFTGMTAIPLASVSILAGSVPIFMSMKNNQTLSIEVPNVSGYIFKSVTIPTLVLDHSDSIGLENKAASDFLGGSVVGKNISEIIYVDGKTADRSFFSDNFESQIVTIMTPTGIKTCDMLLTVESDKYNDALCKIVILRDITEIKYKDELLNAINHATAFLLNTDIESFKNDLFQAMRAAGTAVKTDRVYIWKNYDLDGKLYCSQVYEWSEGAEPQQDNEYTIDISYSENIPGWEETLSKGECINSLVRDMSESEQAQLSPQGILSILVLPVFIQERFWGFVGFDNCKSERVFTESEEAILRSGSLLFAHAYHRNELIQNIRDTSMQLEAAIEQVKAASKAKSDFLSNMSHEMRTPMNAIIGMTSIAIKAKDADEKNQALSKISDASSHLLGVINDVLDMAKIEANKLELVPIEYNFDRMLQKVITVVNFRAEEKRQKLTINVANDIPRFVIGDDQRLAQIITNLMSNAIKFTPDEGSIQIEASLLGETDGVCELRIEVTDSGIGISQEHINRLFEAFEQADSGTSREYGGTGLGLVISKRLVEMMGGYIRVESELGKGSRFIFTIKVLRGKKDMSSLLTPGVNWKNVKVLVVDDLIETRLQFQELFNIIDVKCDTAGDGVEACRLIEENGAYDVYFVDWLMPGMDGIELTRRIKSHGQKAPSIAIMITGTDWEHVRNIAVSAGVDRHMLKPLFSSTIIDCMNEILGSNHPDADHKLSFGEFEGRKLLLAEDIEINREIFLALLDNTGLEIDCAENGKEALEILSVSPYKYDIVFMDVQMPQMDGLEATRRIRALPVFMDRKLPIVAMTANVFKDDIEACLAAGMNDHLGKPLDIDKVLEMLRKYLCPSAF